MLNELLVVERGAVQADIKMDFRHPEIKDAARKPTLHVCLDSQGHVARVRAVASSRYEERPLWKLSEGQKNSFPFVQPKSLWDNATIEKWKRGLGKKPSDLEERKTLLQTASQSTVRTDDLGEWAAKGMMKALRRRRQNLIALERSDVAALPAAIDRFLLAVDKSVDGDPKRLVREIVDKLIQELQVSADSDLLRTAIALFTESANKGGALYFDAEGNFPLRLIDTGIEEPLCTHLRQADIECAEHRGLCSITGEKGVLVVNNFSQPNLPIIQQSFLFARNEAIPSATRYDRTSADSMLVGYMTDVRLRAAIEALCSKDRNGKTWRAIPSEIPKQSDLLIAFVHEVINAPVVDLLAEKGEDYSEEDNDAATNQAGSVAAFEERTKRLFEAVEASISVDWRNTPVSIAIFRKIDRANRKVIYSGAPDASTIYDVAIAWIVGERNIPQELSLWIIDKGGLDPRPLKPPHIAPLALIKISKQIFLRNGKRPSGKKKEQTGLTAAETLKLFLDGARNGDHLTEQRAKRILHLVLVRRTALVAELSHSQRRGLDFYRNYDYYEALRTITLLGVLLHKLNQEKEVYMSGTAFRLGQLLAVADVVHAGYCIDIRGGAIPPSLLGNQVFVMAQTAPAKALATLCRRWKPYAGWARKNNAYRMPDRFTNGQGQWKKRSELKTEAERAEFDKAVAIVAAVSQSRKVASITEKLTGQLPNQCDDIFRAELLLGYMTGIPKNQKDDDDFQNPNTSKEG